ncbi:MAG: RHS repeat-associated core domain-containing protein, partial [Burkholderiales bacterium]
VNAYLYNPAGKWTNTSFHHDALANTVGLSGHDGKVLQTTRYGAFGNVLSESLHDAFPPNRLKYTGREEDPDTGIYYYRARYYDPSIGRFISEDPLGFEAGVNFYAYVGNNPLNANDPTGLVNLRNLGFGLIDFTSSTAEAALGLGVMIASPTTGPAIPAAFWGGTLLAASGALGMGNSALAVRHALYDTSGPGILESAGRFLFGNFGAVVGQGGDLFLSLRPAAIAAESADFVGGVFDILSRINSANGAFGRNSGASNWGPGSPTAVGPFGAASGGFVLYPHRLNTNMIQSAYAK